MRYYTIRLDDACPTMSRGKWGRMERILDHFEVKPMVGIIPNNEDKNRCVDSFDNRFWSRVQGWMKKEWTLALHGYNHVYSSMEGMNGLNPMWRRSEFVGLPLDEQRKKIRNGVAIMREHGICPNYFFAPSHTFDNNTLESLRIESNIRIISDTIGRFPYKQGDFWFIPQIFGHCLKISFAGIYTFSFHPNAMSDTGFKCLENFLDQNRNHFMRFEDIDLSIYGKKRLTDRVLSWFYFTVRKLRKLG